MKKDTLVIIGNGFDLWQGLNTRYSDFAKYYHEHRSEILKKLHIREIRVEEAGGEKYTISSVELIYGDPFDPYNLDADFWNRFEDSLGEIDDERINLFFGKGRSDLRRMKRHLRNAKRILTKAFCDWISTIEISDKENEFRFGDNCFFVNFNYTDTLSKRFGVSEKDIHFIHGSAHDKEPVIFGHSSHPEYPEPFMSRLGGRFGGLYLIETILFETDKHVLDNLDDLIFSFALAGIEVSDIKNVYVLGHSIGSADLGYFNFFVDATSISDPETDREKYLPSNEDEDIDEYISELAYEQFQKRSELRQKKFWKLIKRYLGKNSFPIQNDEPPTKTRKTDAAWHISYYSENDRMYFEKLLLLLGCKNFTLYPTIDSCLENMK